MRHALKAGMNKRKCRSGIVSVTAFLYLARAGMKERRAFIKPYCFWQHCRETKYGRRRAIAMPSVFHWFRSGYP